MKYAKNAIFVPKLQLEPTHGEEIILQFSDQPKLNQTKFLKIATFISMIIQYYVLSNITIWYFMQQILHTFWQNIS